MTQANRNSDVRRDADDGSHRTPTRCAVFPCKHLTQQTAGNGYSLRYCKHHVEHHRRHGSYWHKSITAAQLAPFMRTARLWLRRYREDHRVKSAIAAVESLLQGSGRYENAYSLRGKLPKQRAQHALARLRKAEIDPAVILQRALAVTAFCESQMIDDRQREYRYVQIAKSIHRLASGTHKTTSGFPLPSKYPRSEGQVLRHLGQWLDDIASFTLGGRSILEDHLVE